MKSKAKQHNVKYEEVSERILKSTQTCSHCFALTGPRGRKGLRISAWTCSKCGTQKINNGFKRIYNIINENSANNHRLAYKEVLLSSINSEKNNDLIDNKMEQCLEKESNNKGNKTLRLIKTSPTLLDVKGLEIKLTTL